MFAFIKGTLESKELDTIIIESNDIGYLINTSSNTINTIGDIGANVKVYIKLHVREDAFMLYGFSTKEELNMFKLLISISGIGPKVGLGIISTFNPSKLALAIITEDISILTQAPGVGKKSAQRLILELKDKIKNEQLVDTQLEISNDNLYNNNQKISEVISALLVLGYNKSEATMTLNKIYKDDLSTEDLIKQSLMNLSKN